MKYVINYKGKQLKYRANDWQSFEKESWDIFVWCLDHPEQEAEYQFVVDGKVVSLSVAHKLAQLARKEWEEKRAKTKKPVRISVGATNLPNTYKTVWVKIL
jgi:hypothetical protein